MKRTCIYTLAMSREELATLQKDIEAELAALKRRLNFDEDGMAALDHVAALEAELAFVRTEKRREQAATAEAPRNKEIAEPQTEIAAIQEKVRRLAAEIRLARKSGGPHSHEIARLAREITVLNVEKRRLNLTLPRRSLEREPGRTPTNEDIWLRAEMVPLETPPGDYGESPL